jgi:hypothetical protein
MTAPVPALGSVIAAEVCAALAGAVHPDRRRNGRDSRRILSQQPSGMLRGVVVVTNVQAKGTRVRLHARQGDAGR